MNAEQLQTKLKQFSVIICCYPHRLNPDLVITDGIRFLQKAADASWLIDDIAASLSNVPLKHTTWSYDIRLQVSEQGDIRSGTLVIEDSCDDKIVYYQKKYSDTSFPLLGETKLILELDRGNYTLRLPNEY